MATIDEIVFRAASDQSLLVYFGHHISLDTHEQVRKLLYLLETDPVPGVRNFHPAYCSLLIDFDALKLTHAELEAVLQHYLGRLDALESPAARELEIPVCYGGEYGPDLNQVAGLCGLTPPEVVELHASVTYLVYFLGFVPGFAYLGELPRALSTRRLSSPRRSTPAGSVGIAGSQTGIYPSATPGGWLVIGRTPLAMFQGHRSGMSLLNVGDHVRFRPISATQFAVWKQP